MASKQTDQNHKLILAHKSYICLNKKNQSMDTTKFEEVFEAKLAKNDFIEPKDWMPENY